MRDIPQTKPARGYQGRSVGSVLGRIVAPTLKRRGFREIDILAHWPMIVGPQLAALSCPERISRNGRDTEHGALLTVKVEGAMALEVQHMSPLILERINQHYGAGSIARLNIVQGPLPLDYLKAQAARQTPLAETEIEAAEAALGEFHNSRLKAALARLGARVARRKARDK
ncbi:MAG: DciA family protein [Alphaproteobacteria bacterium]|nr:DciA family protein [Alphaproteobacteria bacterium]